MSKLIALLALLHCSLFAISQQGTSATEEQSLSSRQISRLVNRKFGSLVSGAATGTEVANYASLDPLNGRFIFKGTLPLSYDTLSAKFGFLSLRIEGDLIGSSLASLFSNNVLNTNASADGQLHFRTSNHFTRIRTSGISEAVTTGQKAALDAAYDSKIRALSKQAWDSSLDAQIAESRRKAELHTLRRAAISMIRRQLQDSLNAVQRRTPVNPAEIKKLTEDLLVKSKEELETISEQSLLAKQQDSLIRIRETEGNALRMHLRNEVARAYTKSLNELEMNQATAGFRFGWITLTAGIGKKSFATFYDSLPFPQQLTEPTLTSFRFGLSLNGYWEFTRPRTGVFYGSIGFLRYRDNNLRWLTTQQVVQERVLKNVAGDTVRKIAKTYNAYTKPVVESTVWSLFANAYLVQPASRGAIRFSPSVDIYEGAKTYTNMLFGYIASFKNSKKEQPVVNVEAFVKLNDLFNRQNGERGIWRRTDIGISFTLPLNFFPQ